MRNSSRQQLARVPDPKRTDPGEAARTLTGTRGDPDSALAIGPPAVAPKTSPATTTQPQTFEAIRILIADGDAAFRDNLRHLLETQADFAIVGDVGDGVDAVRLAFETKPDVLVLDFRIPQLSGLEVLRTIKRASLTVRTLLLTGSLERAVLVEILQLGARGFVTRSTPSDLMFKSIRKVNEGELWIGRELMADVVKALTSAADAGQGAGRADFGLTRREREILTLVVEGDTNKGIARRLSVGEDTVKHHLTSIFNKTGVSSRLELALFAIHYHLVELNK